MDSASSSAASARFTTEERTAAQGPVDDGFASHLLSGLAIGAAVAVTVLGAVLWRRKSRRAYDESDYYRRNGARPPPPPLR